VSYNNFVHTTHRFETFDVKNAVTFKNRLKVSQSHWKCHHTLERL